MMVSSKPYYNSFDRLQDLYDKQFFKKALSNADEVLAKHKDHAGKNKQSIFKIKHDHFFIETFAMKALILNGLKRKAEAFAMIQTTLFKNMSNFTCWHVYGLLNKSHK